MIVGVPTESSPLETRVALVPDVVSMLGRDGFDVVVETGAGRRAGFADNEFSRAGARICASRELTLEQADVIAQVSMYSADADMPRSELDRLAGNHIVVGLADALAAPTRVKAMAERGVTAFALELIPRIARAQSMDVLSSMATIAGYRAAVSAAHHLSRCMPLMMTAAGTLPAARVLVIGAGVAGLQAIATAKRLGGRVSGYDIRVEAGPQVESVGGTFLSPHEHSDADSDGYARAQTATFQQRQRELLSAAVAASDIVITTATVPSGRAPVLITADMVASMRPGSVIVDLAASRGGNCQVTTPGEQIDAAGVRVLGPTNIVCSVPAHASALYARNIASFITHTCRGADATVDETDEIVSRTLVCRAGRVVNPRVQRVLQEATSC